MAHSAAMAAIRPGSQLSAISLILNSRAESRRLRVESFLIAVESFLIAVS
jgi:hypothetical protein